jgi:hypothetical protein
MRNIASVVGVAAVAAATFLSPAPATAENGQIAAGVVGGLIGGALLGGVCVPKIRFGVDAASGRRKLAS